MLKDEGFSVHGAAFEVYNQLDYSMAMSHRTFSNNPLRYNGRWR
jgi:hypothetical protein